MAAIYLGWVASKCEVLEIFRRFTLDEECGDKTVGVCWARVSIGGNRLQQKFIKSDAKLWPPECSAVGRSYKLVEIRAEADMG